MRTVYRVIVGNIGTVYEGYSFGIASDTFDRYKQMSINEEGRAAGEDVTLMKDENVLMDYTGKFSQE